MTRLHPSAGPSASPCTDRARSLGPLLAAIGLELRERTDALALLLVERERRGPDRRPLAQLDAECAAHRVELRHAHHELERLGCRLVSLRPTVFSVAAGSGPERALFWCTE